MNEKDNCGNQYSSIVALYYDARPRSRYFTGWQDGVFGRLAKPTRLSSLLGIEITAWIVEQGEYNQRLTNFVLEAYRDWKKATGNTGCTAADWLMALTSDYLKPNAFGVERDNARYEMLEMLQASIRVDLEEALPQVVERDSLDCVMEIMHSVIFTCRGIDRLVQA